MALRLYTFWALTWAVWVWLALGSPPDQAAEWILRTREICFGSQSDGLPQFHGWLSLAAPLPMLLTLLLLCGRELRQQWKRLPRWLAAFCLLLPLSTVGYAAWRAQQGWQARQAQQAAPEEVELPPDYPLERGAPVDLSGLLDQDSQPWKAPGRPWVLTFAYAHCRTVCPGLLRTTRQLPEAIPAAIVTLDPRRDTCGSMAGLARYWELGPTVRVFSGPDRRVEQLTSRLQIPLRRDPRTGDIEHPGLMLVLDSYNQPRYRFLNPPLQWLLTAVHRL